MSGSSSAGPLCGQWGHVAVSNGVVFSGIKWGHLRVFQGSCSGAEKGHRRLLKEVMFRCLY